MQISIVALILTWGFASTAQAQQFATPIDLVETLYSSYFSGLVIDDFAPYLSDSLTAQMDGKVGVSEFEVLGFDPIVGDADWEPRNFKAELLEQGEHEAQARVGFISHKCADFGHPDADPRAAAWLADRPHRRRSRQRDLVHQRHHSTEAAPSGLGG